MATWNQRPQPNRNILPLTQRPGCISGQWTTTTVHTPPRWQPHQQLVANPPPERAQDLQGDSQSRCQTGLGDKILSAIQPSGNVREVDGQNGRAIKAGQSCRIDGQTLRSTGLRLNSLGAGQNQVKVGMRSYREICESSEKRTQNHRLAPVPHNLRQPVQVRSRAAMRDGKENQHTEKNATSGCRLDQEIVNKASLTETSAGPNIRQPKPSVSLACRITVNTKALACKYFPLLTEPLSRLNTIQFPCIPREICVYLLGKVITTKERELLIDYLVRKTEICSVLNGNRCNICNATVNGPPQNALIKLGKSNHQTAISRQKNPQLMALMEVTGVLFAMASIDSKNIQTDHTNKTITTASTTLPRDKEQLTHKAAALMKLPQSVLNSRDRVVLSKVRKEKEEQVLAKVGTSTPVSKATEDSGIIKGKTSVFSYGSVTFKTFTFKHGEDELEITSVEFDKDGWSRMCAAGSPNH